MTLTLTTAIDLMMMMMMMLFLRSRFVEAWKQLGNSINSTRVKTFGVTRVARSFEPTADTNWNGCQITTNLKWKERKRKLGTGWIRLKAGRPLWLTLGSHQSALWFAKISFDRTTLSRQRRNRKKRNSKLEVTIPHGTPENSRKKKKNSSKKQLSTCDKKRKLRIKKLFEEELKIAKLLSRSNSRQNSSTSPSWRKSGNKMKKTLPKIVAVAL